MRGKDYCLFPEKIVLPYMAVQSNNIPHNKLETDFASTHIEENMYGRTIFSGNKQ
jgi:hypothetical protein